MVLLTKDVIASIRSSNVKDVSNIRTKRSFCEEACLLFSGFCRNHLLSDILRRSLRKPPF